jgi:peptide/nickel transport system substrate-binding protein
MTRDLMLARKAIAPVLAATVVLLGACGSGDSGSTDRFRLGTAQAVETLNPLNTQTAAAEGVINLTYPRLVQWNAKQTELVSDLARSWEISPDGKTITFHLRSGKWSDGKPVTADDAAWSLNTFVKYKDGATGSYGDYVAGVADAKATDDKTLVVDYEEAQSNPLAKLQRATILPRHVWEKHITGKDGGGLLDYAPKPPEVVTGGPFNVARYDPDGGVTLLERAPGYYGPKPTVEVLGFKYYTSPDALIAALSNSEIDAIELLPPDVPDDRIKDAGAQVGKTPGGAVDWLTINSNPKKPKHRELLDPEVREALDHAIDRDAIVETAMRGNGVPGSSFLPVSNKFADKAIQPPEFDVALANRLLDEAGYKKGGDGIRVADGEKMSYTIISAPTGNGRAFQIVQKGWRDAGVEVSRRVLDVPALIEAEGAPDGKGLDYDIAQWGFNAQPDPTPMLSLPTCAAIGVFNDPYYCNPAYDRLYEAQSVEEDPDKRLDQVHEMQQILARDRPYVMLDSQTAISAVGEGWKAPDMTSSGYFQIRFSKLPLTTIDRD